MSNILIKFIKTRNELSKSHTELKGFLSDSETITIYIKIKDEFIKKDIKRFYDSMTEASEDYFKDDIGKSEVTLYEDKKFFNTEYQTNIEMFKKIVNFEKNTGLEIKKHFFKISDHNSIDSIYKQIEEHN